jgi:UDP-N-acetylglucosamine 2-epimerase
MKILNIVGARADLVKIARLLTAMRSYDGIKPILVHTGQHLRREVVGNFL